MPHISIKMLKGRTEEQKKAVSAAVAEALQNSLGCSSTHVTVTVEDYTATEWQDVFKAEVADKPGAIYKAPEYDPKDLL